MFDWVENRSLAKGLKYWAYSYSSQQENICDIVFEKTGRGGKVNSTSVYAEAAVQRVL